MNGLFLPSSIQAFVASLNSFFLPGHLSFLLPSLSLIFLAGFTTDMHSYHLRKLFTPTFLTSPSSSVEFVLLKTEQPFSKSMQGVSKKRARFTGLRDVKRAQEKRVKDITDPMTDEEDAEEEKTARLMQEKVPTVVKELPRTSIPSLRTIRSS
jgi:hypothetical protein